MPLAKKDPVFRQSIAWARRYMPMPISFRTVVGLKLDGQKCDGVTTRLKGGGFKIEIERRLNTSDAILTLHHELAHALAIHRYGLGDSHEDQHSDDWGREYARVYSDYWTWIDKQDRKQP